MGLIATTPFTFQDRVSKKYPRVSKIPSRVSKTHGKQNTSRVSKNPQSKNAPRVTFSQVQNYDTNLKFEGLVKLEPMEAVIIFGSGILLGSVITLISSRQGATTSQKSLKIVMPQEGDQEPLPYTGYDWDEYSKHLMDFGREPEIEPDDPDNSKFEELK